MGEHKPLDPSRRAYSLPRPFPAPVTTATRPSKRSISKSVNVGKTLAASERFQQLRDFGLSVSRHGSKHEPGAGSKCSYVALGFNPNHECIEQQTNRAGLASRSRNAKLQMNDYEKIRNGTKQLFSKLPGKSLTAKMRANIDDPAKLFSCVIASVPFKVQRS